MLEDHEVRKMARDILVELLLTGKVEFFGKQYNQFKLRIWVMLIQDQYAIMSADGPKISLKGRTWLNEL